MKRPQVTVEVPNNYKCVGLDGSVGRAPDSYTQVDTVAWVLILCWELENHEAPSGVTNGTRTTRGFTDYFISKIKFFL